MILRFRLQLLSLKVVKAEPAHDKPAVIHILLRSCTPCCAVIPVYNAACRAKMYTKQVMEHCIVTSTIRAGAA